MKVLQILIPPVLLAAITLSGCQKAPDTSDDVDISTLEHRLQRVAADALTVDPLADIEVSVSFSPAKFEAAHDNVLEKVTQLGGKATPGLPEENTRPYYVEFDSSPGTQKFLSWLEIEYPDASDSFPETVNTQELTLEIRSLQ